MCKKLIFNISRLKLVSTRKKYKYRNLFFQNEKANVFFNFNDYYITLM